SHGIGMDVLDHCKQSLCLSDVSVVAAARLPETAFGAVASFDCDSWQPLRRVLAQMTHCAAANGFFYPLENDANVVLLMPRVNDQVAVFRHEHIGPNGEIEFAPCLVNGVGEPLARP